MRKNKYIKPLPFKTYRYFLTFLTFLGLISSGYLSYTHYAVYNIFSYESFCALSQAINCDTVAQSSFSVFLGIPVALWGSVSYFCIITILIFIGNTEKKEEGQWAVLFLIYFMFSLFSLIYGFISLQYIKSICIFCLVTYLVNWLSLFTIIIVFKRYRLSWLYQFKNDLSYWKNDKKLNAVCIGFVFIISLLMIFYPPYWKFNKLENISVLNHGYTKEGFPWIGSENPEVTIVEYTDYQCFACKKTHYSLRRLLEKYPEKLRLVHRNFPMAGDCNPLVNDTLHKNACILAKIAICTEQQDLFWEINDKLFFGKTDNIKIKFKKTGGDYSSLLNCLKSKKINEQLKNDIKSGLTRGVDVTPSFWIYGRLYKGKIPIKKILKDIK